MRDILLRGVNKGRRAVVHYGPRSDFFSSDEEAASRVAVLAWRMKVKAGRKTASAMARGAPRWTGDRGRLSGPLGLSEIEIGRCERERVFCGVRRRNLSAIWVTDE